MRAFVNQSVFIIIYLKYMSTFQDLKITLFNKSDTSQQIYHPIFAKITDSIVSGLLLSYLVENSGNEESPEINKTYSEIRKDLSISLGELLQSRDRLVRLELVYINKNSYILDFENIFYLLKKYNILRYENQD